MDLSDQNRLKLSKSTLVILHTILCSIGFLLTTPVHAQTPSITTPRLAILELQSMIVSIEQKQSWTDLLRKHALDEVPHLIVLDRSHFKV